MMSIASVACSLWCPPVASNGLLLSMLLLLFFFIFFLLFSILTKKINSFFIFICGLWMICVCVCVCDKKTCILMLLLVVVWRQKWEITTTFNGYSLNKFDRSRALALIGHISEMFSVVFITFFLLFLLTQIQYISPDIKQQMNMLIKVINDHNLYDMRFHVSMRLFFSYLRYSTLLDSVTSFIQCVCERVEHFFFSSFALISRAILKLMFDAS